MADFEHALFMLLLLVGVLNAKPARPNLALVAIIAGFLLALIPPPVRLPLPWELILGLTVPLLLWQNGRRLVGAGWNHSVVDLGLWLLAAFGLGFVAWLNPDLGWSGAVLFGLLAASMIWRAIEPEDASTHISQLGPLTLVFLLAETAPAVETPTRYLGGLFSGAAVGIAVAFLAVRLSRGGPRRRRDWIAVGQVYAAYWLGLAIDSSGVVAALMSVVIYLESGVRADLWEAGDLRPAPLNAGPVFGLALALFMFLGWQTHRPIDALLLGEVALGMVVGLAITWIGRWLEMPGFAGLPVWMVGARVALLLFPALLLWPRTTLLQPLQLAIAVGVAAVASIAAATSLSPLVDLQVPHGESVAEEIDPAAMLDQVATDDWKPESSDE